MSVTVSADVVGSGRSRGARSWRAAALLTAALVVAVVLSLAVGARPTAPATVLAALLDPASLLAAGREGDLVAVRDLRLPRTVVGLVVGVALGLAGVVMQGLTRNPVADPGLLGVNAGAAFAVVVAIAVTGATTMLALAGAGLLGALAASAVIGVVAVSSRAGSTPALLVVAGTAVTAGLTSLTTLVLLSDPVALDRFRFWTVGSLNARGLDAVTTLGPLVVLGAVVAVGLARALDALALGDDVARGLGFRLSAVRALGLGAVVVLCGTATALAGPLVFVGLVGAHAARAFVRGHARLLPVAAVVGAVLVLLADTAGRVVAPPGELEVGIVVAAVGAPVLVALVRSGRTVGV